VAADHGPVDDPLIDESVLRVSDAIQARQQLLCHVVPFGKEWGQPGRSVGMISDHALEDAAHP